MAIRHLMLPSGRTPEGQVAFAPIHVAPLHSYIETKENWLYLADIIDMCSRKIVEYVFGNDLSTSLVLKAFEQACWKRKPERGLFYHSNRGCQYSRQEFQKRLNQADKAASMSRKGNCYDNAMQKSFWATLKAEYFGNSYPKRNIRHK